MERGLTMNVDDGKQAEPILAKSLKLRYQLLPYTYSLAYQSYQPALL